MSEYPDGFETWETERRDEFFAGKARAYRAQVDGGFDDRSVGQPPSSVSLRRASEIEAVGISWVWRGWLARGKMQLIGGQPGAGKTTLAIKIAATVSACERWPDGSFATSGNVVIWSGEDDPADTLVPRLSASGADLEKVFVVEHVIEDNQRRSFDPAKDIVSLRHAIEKAGGAALIIVDPVVSAVAADSHKNSETRRALQPLVDLAREADAALLGIHHFSKGTAGREPIERITGSVAFGALARVVMVAAKEPDAEDGTAGRRIFARAKSNIGPDDGGFAYSLDLVPMPGHPDITASVAVWGDRIDGTAKEMLAVAEAPDGDEAASELQEAIDFLLDFLLDGPRLTKEVKKAGADCGQSWRTIRRAQQSLGIKPAKRGMTEGWEWSLPEGGQQNPKMSIPETLDTFEKVGHLRGLNGALTDSLDDLEERKAMAAGSCPEQFLDAYSRLQCQRPLSISDADWRQAIDDTGQLLDRWGSLAAEFQWTPGELFDLPSQDMPGGLVWWLRGEQVEALGPRFARTKSGRTFNLETGQ
ncbi:MAG: AAA family ATPase [Xanthobacteraceae bacterium]